MKNQSKSPGSTKKSHSMYKVFLVFLNFQLIGRPVVGYAGTGSVLWSRGVRPGTIQHVK